jgi:hypothetical protein
LLLLGFCCWYVNVGNFAAFWRGIKSMFWFYLVVGKCKQMGLVELSVCQRNGTEVFVLCLCMNVISIILKQMDINWLWFSFLTPVF